MITVDMRVPFAWATSAGAAPHWIEGLTIPMVGIPCLKAINLVEQMPLAAELTLDARCFPDTSSNVIGQIWGREKQDEVIIVSGHHDCVAENVGADDNGSGVIFTLELGRILARRRRPRRTVRFISYGVEERVSIGSYLYMRAMKLAEQKQIVFAANADSISSAVGTDEVRVTGTPLLEQLVRRVWMKQRHPANIEAKIHAFSDHFPLNIVGVPSICLGRPGIANGGCWQLHSSHDNPAHVSATVLARSIDTAAELIMKVADAPCFPFLGKLNQNWHGKYPQRPERSTGIHGHQRISITDHGPRAPAPEQACGKIAVPPDVAGNDRHSIPSATTCQPCLLQMPATPPATRMRWTAHNPFRRQPVDSSAVLRRERRDRSDPLRLPGTARTASSMRHRHFRDRPDHLPRNITGRPSTVGVRLPYHRIQCRAVGFPMASCVAEVLTELAPMPTPEEFRRTWRRRLAD